MAWSDMNEKLRNSLAEKISLGKSIKSFGKELKLSSNRTDDLKDADFATLEIRENGFIISANNKIGGFQFSPELGNAYVAGGVLWITLNVNKGNFLFSGREIPFIWECLSGQFPQLKVTEPPTFTDRSDLYGKQFGPKAVMKVLAERKGLPVWFQWSAMAFVPQIRRVVKGTLFLSQYGVHFENKASAEEDLPLFRYTDVLQVRVISGGFLGLDCKFSNNELNMLFKFLPDVTGGLPDVKSVFEMLEIILSSLSVGESFNPLLVQSEEGILTLGLTYDKNVAVDNFMVLINSLLGNKSLQNYVQRYGYTGLSDDNKLTLAKLLYGDRVGLRFYMHILTMALAKLLRESFLSDLQSVQKSLGAKFELDGTVEGIAKAAVLRFGVLSQEYKVVLKDILSSISSGENFSDEHFEQICQSATSKIEEARKFEDMKSVLNGESRLSSAALLDTIDIMDGFAFEDFMNEVFRALGYMTVPTKKVGDQGVDLIIAKNSEQYAVQLKRYSGAVGNSSVQEVIAGKQFYHCTSALVLTNSTFTASAIELATKTGVLLWDRSRLTAILDDYVSVKNSV